MREQRVPDHDLRHRVGRVRELERRADVARRVDARVAGPQARVDPHAGTVVRHPGLVQPESLHVRRPAHADEDLVHDRLARRAGRGVTDPFPRAAPPVRGNRPHFADRRVEGEPDPVVLHPRPDHRRRVRILPRQDARGPLEHRHFAAEAGERLGELAADRTGADDGEPARQLRQREDRLVGQEARLRQPRNRRRRGSRPGADGGPREPQRGVADAHRIAPAEASRADEDVDAESLVPLGGVDAADRRAQPAHAGHGGPEVALDAARERQAELRAVPRGGPDARGPDDPLRGDAADVQAVAAHQAPLDQRDPGPDSRRHRGGHEARRAGADHDQVVASAGRGVLPPGRMDVRDELPVERVAGNQAVHRWNLFGCRRFSPRRIH